MESVESRTPPRTLEGPLPKSDADLWELFPQALGAQVRIALNGPLQIGGKGEYWDLICKQLEVADILKSPLLPVSGLVFLFLFFVTFFQTRTANPVIRFLPRTKYTVRGCQAVEGGEGELAG